MRFDRLTLLLLLSVLPGAFWPGSTSYEVAKFLVLALACGALLLNGAWRIGRGQELSFPGAGPIVTWGILLLVILWSAYLGENASLALRTFVLTAAWVMILWLVSSRTREEAHLRWLLRALTFGAVLTSLYGLAQIRGWAPAPDAALGVPPGISTFGNENQMAGLAAVSFWAALGLMVLSRNRAEYMSATLAVFVLLAAVMRAEAEGPKLAVFGAVVFIVPCWLMLRVGWRAHVGWLGPVLISLGAVAVIFVFVRILEPQVLTGLPLPDFVTRGLAANSGDIRRTDWLVAWHLVQQNGAGMSGAGSYQVLWPETRAALSTIPAYGDLAEHIPVATRAHNDYLQGFAELGAVGLTAFLAIAGSFLVVFRRRWREMADARLARTWLFLTGGVVTIAIHALVSFPLHLPAPAFALAGLLGLSAAPVFGSDDNPYYTRRLPQATLVLPAALGLLILVLGVREFVGDLHVARGESAYTARQFPLALSELKHGEAYMIWPDQGDLYLGLTLTALERNDEAVDALETHLRHRPAYEAMLGLAELRTAQQDYRAALSHLDMVDGCRPTQEFRLQSRYLRAMVSLRQKDYPQARMEFDELLNIAPRYHRGLLAAGYLSVLEGKRDEARQYYQQALRLIEEDLKLSTGPDEAANLRRMLETARRSIASVD